MQHYEKKTLVFIGHSPDFYGAEKVLFQIVESLRGNFNIHVVVPKPGPMTARLNELSDVTLHMLPLPEFSSRPASLLRFAVDFWPYILRLRRIMREVSPSLVYCNTIRNILTAAACWGYATVVHIHEKNVSGPAGFVLAKVLGRFPKRVIFVCTAARESFATYAPGLRKNGTVIYNGTREIDVAPADAPAEFLDRFPRLLSMAQLAPHKRVADLVKAMPAVRKAYPNAMLVVLGEGEEREKLEREVLELGLSATVRFPGYRSDAPAYLQGADIFLAPFENEACNLSVIEAMRHGKPVVAAHAGGLPEIVAAGTTGLLHLVGDVAALAEDVIALAGSEKLRREMGVAAHKRGRERFDLEGQLESIRGVIAEAIAAFEDNQDA